MKIETVKKPKTFKELERLAKDESVMVVYNIYNIMLDLYKGMNYQPDESFRYDSCWKMKPLCIVFAKGKPESVFYRILDERDGLIRIK